MELTVDRLKQDQRMYSWLRKIYPTLTDADKEEARQIFPEVLESEDERIRGAIHIYLDWLDGRKDCQPKGDYTIRDMIAYLEKQKEHTSKRYRNNVDAMKRMTEFYINNVLKGRWGEVSAGAVGKWQKSDIEQFKREMECKCYEFIHDLME